MKAVQYTLFAILGIMFLTVVIGGAVLLTGSGKSYTINTSGPAVLKQLQSMNRYETASFTIEKIIDAGTNGSEWQNLLFGDKILLIAHGRVIAGFDLAELKDTDITAENGTVTLKLPAPKILETALDNDKTRVFDRQTGLLTKGDKDLESRARAAAESSIRQAACESNILADAAKNGKSQLTALLKALGYTKIIISIPAAHC